MNENCSRDAAAMTGSAPKAARIPEADNAITPPVDSGALVAGTKGVPAAPPGDEPPPPPQPPILVSITITSPPDEARVVGPREGVPVMVAGTYVARNTRTNAEVGVNSITIKVLGEEYITSFGSNQWWGTFETPVGGDLEITAKLVTEIYYDGELISAESPPIRLLTDAVPPVLSVENTTAETDITGNWFATIDDPRSTIATIHVEGIASDSMSGVKEVDWILDGGVPNLATTANIWANWNADIPLQLGIHSLTFRCSDVGGNEVMLTYQVTIARSASVFAVNPRDYLQALLLFATDPSISVASQPQLLSRVTVSGQNLTEGNLTEAFYQPFGDLLLDANQAQANEPIHQPRLCIEVLRKYLATKSLTGSQAAALAKAETAYRQAAYTALLVEIGTSYNEIRLARSDEQDKRQALADRLGIDLDDTRPDHLDALFIDPGVIDEAMLEQIFGLVKTTHDPLSAPPLPKLQGWRGYEKL